MNSTHKDGVGILDSELDRSKRAKYSHPNAAAAAAAAAVAAAGYPQSGGMNANSSPFRNSSEGINAELLTALQGANSSSSLSSTLQSMVGPPAAAAPVPSFDNRPQQQDLLRSLLLRQQLNNVIAPAAPVAPRGNDLQQLLLAQLARSTANGQFSMMIQPDGQNRNAFAGLGNMDLLTRASALSGTSLLQPSVGGLASSQGGGGGGTAAASSSSLDANRLIAQLLAAQRKQQQQPVSNHHPLSNFEAQIAAASRLSTGNQNPQNNSLVTSHQFRDILSQQQRTIQSNSGRSTDMVGSQQQQQQQQQRQFMLGTSIGASLPDAAFRQMTNPPASFSTNLLQTPALEERIRALRAGLVDKTPGVASTNATVVVSAKLDPTASAAYPLTSYEGDRLTPMALPSEQWVMSDYQCLLRQQIVFVEANANENGGKTQGRNKPIIAGQGKSRRVKLSLYICCAVQVKCSLYVY